MKRRRRLTAKGKVILLMIALIIASVIYPALSESKKPGAGTTPHPSSGGLKITIESAPYINLYINGKIEKILLEDYVAGVVAAEMPASYELEALKAQAVASRTYAQYLKEHGGCSSHPGADVSADSSSCQAYITEDQMTNRWGSEKDAYLQKIREAVDSTRGQKIYFGSDIIEALYFACSGGYTEDCANVFSQSRPYLLSVESEGEEGFSNYYGEVSLSPEKFVSAMKEYSPSIDIDKKSIASGISDIIRSNSGRVESIKIGNESFTGREIRAIFSLNSTNFTINVSDEITFKTKGFGHGVGMSQDGADAMAKKGATYTDILKHYYTGVIIK